MSSAIGRLGGASEHEWSSRQTIGSVLIKGCVDSVLARGISLNLGKKVTTLPDDPGASE